MLFAAVHITVFLDGSCWGMDSGRTAVSPASTPGTRPEGVTERTVRRLREGAFAPDEPDLVAVEEPLEIRVAGDPVAVTMRTPGDDARLAVGFLFSEGILESIDDVGRAVHCGRPGTEEFGNVIDVLPGPGVSLDVERVRTARRGTLTTSACGVCGRRSIQDLMARSSRPVPPGPSVAAGVLFDVMDRLQLNQPAFSRTGGVHAAAVFPCDGDLLYCFEDVGRHNSVDKVVGALLFERRVGANRRTEEDRRPAILTVSGRTSFEILQKASLAEIPIVASVSAASSLAVDLAVTAGITLVGFCRGTGFNIYSHPERIR